MKIRREKQKITRKIVLLRMLCISVLLAYVQFMPSAYSQAADRSQIKKTRKALKSKEFDKKLEAIQRTAEYDDKGSISRIIRILENDDNPIIRQYACETIAKIADSEVVPDLLEIALAEEDPAVKIEIINALRSIGGEEAGDAIIEIYSGSTHSGVKVMAVNSMDNFKGNKVDDFLKDVSREGSKDEKRSAVRGLGRKGDKQAIIDALEDEDEDVRLEAVDTLGFMGDKGRIRDLESSGDEKVRDKARKHLKRWRR